MVNFNHFFKKYRPKLYYLIYFLLVPPRKNTISAAHYQSFIDARIPRLRNTFRKKQC